MDIKTKNMLKKKATNTRITALSMINQAQSGHIGGSFSVIDILTVLYDKIMNVDPMRPKWNERDRLVMSKGHCTPALYSILSEKGYFPKKDLKTFRNINSYLSGHAEMKVPGVDMSTGSLGQGLSVACGMAMAAKMENKEYNVYSINGDGELQEGMIWEAVMTAAKYKLDNLIVIVDNNRLQLDGTIDEIMPSLNSIGKKFDTFGWHVMAVDGHDYEKLHNTFVKAKEIKNKPVVIVAKTVKGKGVSFMENDVSWHGSVPSKEQYRKALSELNSLLKSMEV